MIKAKGRSVPEREKDTEREGENERARCGDCKRVEERVRHIELIRERERLHRMCSIIAVSPVLSDSTGAEVPLTGVGVGID